MFRIALVCSALLGVGAQSVAKRMMPVSGLKCNGNQSAYVLYPDDGNKYPLISFAHGLNAWDTTIWFPYVLEGMAKSGYVVVAVQAATGWCDTQHLDQIRGLEWALGNSDLLPHIDTAAGTGIAGHSMGGGATITSASDAAATAKHNIKVALAMHPASGNPNAPKIPILYLTGTADSVVSPSSVLKQYKAAAVADKTFVNVVGATHVNACGCPGKACEGLCSTFPASWGGCPNTEDHYYYTPFDCYIKGDKDACTRMHTCKVTNAQTGKSLPVSECLHTPETDLITV